MAGLSDKKITKKKRCSACGKQFAPKNTLQKACSIDCAIKIAPKAREKAHKDLRAKERADLRRRKGELRTVSDALREAQSAFNKYIRIVSACKQ